MNNYLLHQLNRTLNFELFTDELIDLIDYYTKEKEYYTSGELCREYYLVNGKLEGVLKIWWQNSKPCMECNYKDGKKHGLYIGWRRDGNLWINCIYKNGENVIYL